MIQFQDFTPAYNFLVTWDNFKTKLSGTGKAIQGCFQSFELWTGENTVKLVVYDDAEGRVQTFLDEINEDPAGSVLKLQPRSGDGGSFYTRRFEGVRLVNDHISFTHNSSNVASHTLTLVYNSSRTILHGRTEDE